MKKVVSGVVFFFAALGVAHAQLTPPPVLVFPIQKPPAPRVSAPPLGVQPANAAASQSIVLRWYQSAVTNAQPVIGPTQFMICLKAPTQNCDWSLTSAANGVWNFAPSASNLGPGLTRTPVYSGSPFGGYRILLGYDYAATLTLATSLFDRELKWTVGSCSRSTTDSCSFVTPGNVQYTTRELVIDGAILRHQATATGREVFGAIEYRNAGTTAFGGFDGFLQIHEALVDGGRCDLNIAHANPMAASVVLDNGTIVRPNEIPAGRAVNAILGPSRGSPGYPYSPLPSIAPGDTAFVEGFPSNRTRPNFDFSWLPGETQRAYVIVARIDSNNSIVESNESDNGLASCYMMFR